jgi:hypothetical protein
VDLLVMLDQGGDASGAPHCHYGVRLDLRARARASSVGWEQGQPGVGGDGGPPGILTPAAVAELATDLHTEESFAYWLMDLGSPGLLKMLAKTWGTRLAAGKSPLQFAPAENTRFFGPYGWKEREYRSMFEESIRLKRTVRFASLWKLLGKLYPRKKREELKRFSGIALLERV